MQWKIRLPLKCGGDLWKNHKCEWKVFQVWFQHLQSQSESQSESESESENGLTFRFLIGKEEEKSDYPKKPWFWKKSCFASCVPKNPKPGHWVCLARLLNTTTTCFNFHFHHSFIFILLLLPFFIWFFLITKLKNKITLL